MLKGSDCQETSQCRCFNAVGGDMDKMMELVDPGRSKVFTWAENDIFWPGRHLKFVGRGVQVKLCGEVWVDRNGIGWMQRWVPGLHRSTITNLSRSVWEPLDLGGECLRASHQLVGANEWNVSNHGGQNNRHKGWQHLALFVTRLQSIDLTIVAALCCSIAGEPCNL
jgi:hypothetical protein